MVAPLDWGLGHATRCIPIITGLINNGYEVVIAASGAQAILLQTEFPSLQFLPLQGYRVTYTKKKWLLPFMLLIQLPRLLNIIKKEHRWLDNIIKEHSIGLVISDNRYGLSSQKIPCIFITHQLTIKTPFVWLEKIIQRINYHYINRYATCWVPDIAGEINVAGILSHPLTLPRTKVVYTGLLSRFKMRTVEKKYDCCILLSGPEPQRTLLEEKIIHDCNKTAGNILLVRGKPGSDEILHLPSNITVRNHLPGTQLQEAILQSEYIVCRSGYTSVMELLSLQKKAILIPTPGQTEQEYIAEKLLQNHFCMSVEQKSFDLEKNLAMAKTFPYQFTSLVFFSEEHINDLLKASV